MEAVILIGIQGSGKSTFYRDRFFNTHVRINLNILKRRSRHGGEGCDGSSSYQRAMTMASLCDCSSEPSALSKSTVVRVGRETKGRRGKGVTIISDLPLDENGLTELAAKLKTRLGTGGTVKDGRIEIQGDHRDRIVDELEGLGYLVKRAGG